MNAPRGRREARSGRSLVHRLKQAELKNAFIADSGGLRADYVSPGAVLVTEPGVDDFVEVALQLTARDEARARTRRRLALELGGSFHGAFMHGGSVDAPSVAQLP